jgi:hypothetical protein
MSTFEDSHYRWRETYFVLFKAGRRPKLKAVEKAISAINHRYELKNQTADEKGLVDSLTVVSPDDYAALDICFVGGEEVKEQEESFLEDLKKSTGDTGLPVPIEKIRSFDGRFDVLHFERVVDFPGEEDNDELLDPSALLIVLEALAKLTGGLAIDPQSGTILENDE